MAVRKYITPKATVPMVDKQGVPTVEWQRYLGGLQDVSSRVAANVENLAGGASPAEVIAKVNELLAALQAANQQEAD